MDDEGGTMASLIFFGVLLLMEMLLFGFDSALDSLNFKEISKKADEKDKRAGKLRDILLKPQIYNSTFQLAVTLIQLMMGGFILIRMIAFSKRYVDIRFGVPGVIMVTVLLLYILLTFGMLIPRKLAAEKPEKWATSGVWTIGVLMLLFRPMTGLVRSTSRGILWLFNIKPDKEVEDVTEEEIISMVNEGHEQGVLMDTAAEMITNIFELDDKVAKDIMTHRSNMLLINSETTLSEAMIYMLGEGKSRFPVYEGNIDHIIGIMHLRDAMRAHMDVNLRDKPLSEIEGPVREAVFIPETKKIDGLFQFMKQAKAQMVVVVDEYGQTAGVIAMEDILEEIVGNIMDEYDEDEDYIEETGNRNEYIIEGKTRLEDLEERFQISFQEEEFETLNGFLISKMDKIPDDDELFDIDVEGYNFKIFTVENKMITSVLVTKKEWDVTEE